MTPYIDRVTRILERLEQREAREACPVPAAPIPSPHAEHTTRPVAQHDVPVPPVRERNTLHQYFERRSTNSPPTSEASYGEAGSTTSVTADYKTAQPVCQDVPPSWDGPPRRWFHTAAGEWIDLAKLDPVDWTVVSTNSSNSVAYLQPPFREGHTARGDMLTARPQCEPPADIFLANDQAGPGEDAAWHPTGDEITMTAGDTKVVDYAPELIDHTDSRHPTEHELRGTQPATPSA